MNNPTKSAHPILKWLWILPLVFLSYSLITVVVFKHRIDNISTRYSMPDVDTDGGLWYQWYLSYIQKNGLVYDVMNLESYPLGYDVSFAPSKNLIYSLHVVILNQILGYSWQNLILINNVSALSVYPIAALGAFILCYYLTKNKLAGFFCGLVYGFSFYAVFMGRGTMSINHIEFIPFYFLSLVYYLDNKRLSSLTLSIILFSIMFRADAYYAFWSGLFSLIFVFFYKPESLRKTLYTVLKYYLPLFIVLFLMNVEFLTSQLPIMFNKQTLIQTGRNSNPRDELTNLRYYLSLPLYPINRLREYVGRISLFMTIPLYISILAMYLERKRLHVILLFCFLASVALSAFIPGFYEINLLYFKYFGMFRGVGRLGLFAPLFLAILTGVGIGKLVETGFYRRLPKIKLLAFPLLGLVILMSNLNNDATWYRLTDMAKFKKLYDPIVENQNIRAIASYPMALGSGDAGFPQPYELMGQIIHGKPLAAGLSQFATDEQKNFQSQIKDITNPATVDALAKYGINTILIRNRLLADSLIVNTNLKADQRLRFIGDYAVPTDERNGRTNNDKSRNISLYEIKKPQLNLLEKPILYMVNPKASVTFKKISASKYTLEVSNYKEGDLLILNLPYSEKWQLYEDDLANTSDLAFLAKKPILSSSHVSFHEYANSWSMGKSDSVEPTKLTLFFKSQSIIHLDEFSAYLTSFALIALYLTSKVWEERKKYA